jgi:hypothetical protein
MLDQNDEAGMAGTIETAHRRISPAHIMGRDESPEARGKGQFSIDDLRLKADKRAIANRQSSIVNCSSLFSAVGRLSDAKF